MPKRQPPDSVQKTCKKCNTTKGAKYFYVSRQGRLSSKCRECQTKHSKNRLCRLCKHGDTFHEYVQCKACSEGSRSVAGWRCNLCQRCTICVKMSVARTCPLCNGRKAHYSNACRQCADIQTKSRRRLCRTCRRPIREVCGSHRARYCSDACRPDDRRRYLLFRVPVTSTDLAEISGAPRRTMQARLRKHNVVPGDEVPRAVLAPYREDIGQAVKQALSRETAVIGT